MTLGRRLRERRCIGARAAAFERLGADVTVIFDRPDGTNINDGCGALHPEVVAAEVVRLARTPGVAYDGDADRALFADAAGNVSTAIRCWRRARSRCTAQGTLRGDTVVTTVMANLGFHLAMARRRDRGGRSRRWATATCSRRCSDRCRAGRRAVRPRDLPRAATTGDGLLTAVRFLSLAAARGVSRGGARLVHAPLPAGDAERPRARPRGAGDAADAVGTAVARGGGRPGRRRPRAGPRRRAPSRWCA